MFFRRTSHRPSPLSTDRLEAFSDGVFAVAITLLVLTLTVPELTSAEVAEGKLFDAVMKLWPKALSYGISFFVIGIFWIGHHILFRYIRRLDRTVQYLNILLLMSVSFFPFPVALIGSYGRERIAVVLYGVTVAAIGLLYEWIWCYATYRRRLVDPALTPQFVRKGTFAIMVAPLTYLVAVGCAFINPAISIVVYILVPFFYVLPGALDELIEQAPPR